MKSFGIILIFALLVFSLLKTVEPEVKEVIKTEKVQVPIVKEVPVVKEVTVVKEVPVIKEVVKRVEVVKEVPVVREVYREPQIVNEAPPVQNFFSPPINQERRFMPTSVRAYPVRPRQPMVSRPYLRQVYAAPRMSMNHYYPRQPVFRPAFGRRR